MTDNSISLAEPAPQVGSTAILVRNDIAFSETIRVESWIGSPSNFLTLNIQVCGLEAIDLVETETQRLVVEAETSDV